MSAKHTPGTWESEQDANGGGEPQASWTIYAPDVLEPGSTAEDPEPRIVAVAYTRGDARLIAAATDLLAACRRVLASENYDTIEAAKQDAAAAIIKATGTKP